jgi:hypothetical protein
MQNTGPFFSSANMAREIDGKPAFPEGDKAQECRDSKSPRLASMSSLFPFREKVRNLMLES